MKYRQPGEKIVGLLRINRINVTCVYMFTQKNTNTQKMRCSLVEKTTLIPKKCSYLQQLLIRKFQEIIFKIPYNKQNWRAIKFNKVIKRLLHQKNSQKLVLQNSIQTDFLNPTKSIVLLVSPYKI